MIILREPNLSETAQCPYFDDLSCTFRYFFAYDVTGDELDALLSGGWRKFGTYFFRPECGPCRRCTPLRILTREFTPNKNQRRVLKKASPVEVRMSPLDFRDEVYDVYRDHSLTRFGKVTEVDEFIATFYARSCPSLQSEYYDNGILFGVGFLDRSSDALSSAYFTFRNEYGGFSPGTLSVIKEIEFASALDLSYYYLGYYIEKNRSMSYKNRFHPYEWYDWETKCWLPETLLEKVKSGF